MKLLAFTDLHGNLKALDKLVKKVSSYKVELIVCAGDFSQFGHLADEVLSRLDKIGLPVILIHGNHEDEDDLRALLKKRKHIIMVHKDIHEYKNFVFIGYGGGGFSSTEPDFVHFSKKHKTKKNLILITHQPPYMTALDTLDDGWYCGNVDFRHFIETAKPVMAICGHIHENQYKQDTINSTFIINPGPLGRVIELNDQDFDKK